MAGELQALVPTGLSLYAVVLNSAGEIWNGASFVAINSLDWASYDIALIELTAGIYLGDLPAVNAGIYTYNVYERAGLNPAITDVQVGNGWLNWDGLAVLPLSAVDGVVDTIRVDTNTTIPGLLATVQADLDNPDQYKANVLPIETTLEEIKGAGWNGETLVAIKTIIDAILVDTETDLPAYLVGLQNWLATEIEDSIASGVITQIRGNTWSITLDNVVLDPNQIQLAVKSKSHHKDEDALLFIDSQTGLIYVNGIEALDHTLASLVYVGTSLTINVHASINAQLPLGDHSYGLQSITAGGVVSEAYTGTFSIIADIVRSTN